VKHFIFRTFEPMSNAEKPLIFITNDDGISAKGIASLIEVAKGFGDVVVIAPDKPQSAMGHAITIHHPLRLHKNSLFTGVDSYECSGTPVDCVKLGVYEVLHKKPTLLLSGINHGANTACNVLYSGTMSAAIEGAMEGVPSIGFSLCDFDYDADFTEAQFVAEKIIAQVLETSMGTGIAYNVNIPKSISGRKIEGIKVCRQANAFWAEKFEKRIDQFNKPYYWLGGELQNEDFGEDTDLFAIEHHYTSLVPTQFDLTAYHELAKIKHIDL
jgi:5'-nucleotidase